MLRIDHLTAGMLRVALLLTLAAGCGDDDDATDIAPDADMFVPSGDSGVTMDGAGPTELDCSPLFDGESSALLALDTCDELGSERVCYIVQEDCELQVWCDDSEVSGTVEPGRQITFPIDGAECAASHDGDGWVGSCAAAGGSCDITEVEPEAGGDECPTVPSLDFRSRGCGSASIACLEALQHGCAFMAAPCSLGRFPFLVIAGETSYSPGTELPHLSFNGAPGFECYVEEPSESEIGGGRDPLEWRGQCETAAGGMCRASGGFYGLQLFFESDEPDACAAEAADAVSTVGCNGGFASGDPEPNEVSGSCTVGGDTEPAGSCVDESAYCAAEEEGGTTGQCLALCSPSSSYVSTGGCPNGYRCFTLGTNGICFRDCDASNPCPSGYSCDAEGSCVAGS